MAMVDAMPVPDSRQKVDELFLFWLSEPSTQEMLRNELTKVCRNENELTADGSGDLSNMLGNLVQPATTLSNIQRSSSPNYRTPSPPLHLSNAPKSPRTKRRAKSPRRSLKHGLLAAVEKSAASGSPGSNSSSGAIFDDVDYFPSALNTTSPPYSFEPDTRGESSGSNTKPERENTTTDREAKKLDKGKRRGDKGRHEKAAKSDSEVIPRFFFPNGRLTASKESVDDLLKEVEKVFQEQLNGEIAMSNFHLVTKALKLPLYWKAPLFRACISTEVDPSTVKAVTFPMLKKTWLRICQCCHDDAARFVKLLAVDGRTYLIESDFEPLIQDIVDTHPGLAFLATALEFHSRYVETVISRIFYTVDRTWNNRITVSDLRRSNFLEILKSLEDESDINAVTDYFSYEHFYVIYCKFWELDTDHDLIIDVQDLSRHADHSLTPLVIERIMSGVVTRDRSTPAGKLSYKDFIWFLLSEEDKTTQRSIEYWFRCLDVDGDGVLSLYELQLFYDEVLSRLRELSIECLSVENTVCQVLDMVNPRKQNMITLSDLKSCKLTPFFYNTFINVEKYLEYEQRDPVTTSKDDPELPCSDWDRYAADQYQILLAEEAYEQDDSNTEEDAGDSDLCDEEREMLALL